MIEQFANLSESEVNALAHAPAHVILLIAGADGKIDESEIKWSEKVTHYRTFSEDDTLNSYYQKVDENLHELLKSKIAELSDDTAARNQQISDGLAGLNDILGKIDADYAKELVASWRSLAEHTAKADGGFLGFASISAEEKKLLSLEMLNY